MATAILLDAGAMSAVARAQAPAPAETTSSENSAEQIAARREALFARLIQNPADLDAAFEYAMLSAQVGELEAAVSTLERMLIFAPGLPRVQLELGVLYFRLKAFESARAYLTKATAGPDVPEPVRQRVAVFLAAIDSARSSSHFAGSVTAGVQWQSNANAAPAARGIVLNDLEFLLSGESTASPDVNYYLAATGYYTHKLGEAGDLFEVLASLYGSRQHERDELDTLIGEVLFGPSFDLGRFGADGARAGIYGIFGAVGLDDNLYTTAYGGGARLELPLGERARSTTRVEVRERKYYDTKTSMTLHERDGTEVRGAQTLTVLASARTIVEIALFGDRTDTDADYYSHTEGAASLSITQGFPPLVGDGTRPWTVTLTGGGLVRRYDDPDPLVNMSEREEDTETWAYGTLFVPVGETAGVSATVGVRDRESNYPTQDYTNVSTKVAVTKAF